MALINRLHSRSLVLAAQNVETRKEILWRSSLQSCLSSVAYISGSTSTPLRLAADRSHQRRCCSKPMTSVIRAAGSKQKKKAKEKRKSSSSGDKQWKFDELMLVWDDVFVKACENSNIATALYDLSRNGLAQYGRGCILMQESVTTRPRGAASGFTFKSRYSSSSSPELPSYNSIQWEAKYVPKEFILDPSKAPASSSLDVPSPSMEDDTIQVVDQGKLMSVLRGMDRTRLLGLLFDPESDDPAGAKDAGGEEPCDQVKDELIVMLVVLVDGQQAVGADVLKAFPTGEDGISSNATSLWTLKLRDDVSE